MGLIRESEDIDFTIRSQPWTDEELTEFRLLMKKIKEQAKKKSMRTGAKNKKVWPLGSDPVN